MCFCWMIQSKVMNAEQAGSCLLVQSTSPPPMQTVTSRANALDSAVSLVELQLFRPAEGYGDAALWRCT